MFENVCRVVCACALSATLVFAAPPAQSKKTVDFSRFVVMGDSLSAGVENFSLLDSQQPNGYASLIAGKAHALLPLPLVPYPGAPNVLQLISFGPPPVIQPAPGMLLLPRDNPLQQPYNISVPGITLADSLTM